MKPTTPDSNPDPRDDALDEAAAEWLWERDEGFGPGRAEAFAAWCAADPRHAAAFAQVERSVARLERMPMMRTPLERRFGRPGTVTATATALAAKVEWSSRRIWLSGMAAALVLGVIAWWQLERIPAFAERYATGNEPARRVALPDGSVLHLNAQTALQVAYSRGERRVRLESGEAHFEVARDPARPFVVAAGDVAVRAVGTAFDVRLAGESVAVLVEEGRVEVTALPTASPTLATSPAAATPALVRAGEGTQVPRRSPVSLRIAAVEPRALREALAWHNPILTLSNMTLSELVERFNRRNQVQLALADEELGRRRLGGVLALNQVEAFVGLLERQGDIVARRPSPEVIVFHRVP